MMWKVISTLPMEQKIPSVAKVISFQGMEILSFLAIKWTWISSKRTLNSLLFKTKSQKDFNLWAWIHLEIFSARKIPNFQITESSHKTFKLRAKIPNLTHLKMEINQTPFLHLYHLAFKLPTHQKELPLKIKSHFQNQSILCQILIWDLPIWIFWPKEWILCLKQFQILLINITLQMETTFNLTICKIQVFKHYRTFRTCKKWPRSLPWLWPIFHSLKVSNSITTDWKTMG